jgi:pimeloyl-ACP methyl ester carboxylesterase
MLLSSEVQAGPDSIGKMMTDEGEALDTQIIGVAKDAKYSEVKGEVPPLFFSPYKQAERIRSMTFYVKTAADPEQFQGQIPRIMQQIDPNLPVEARRGAEAAQRRPTPCGIGLGPHPLLARARADLLDPLSTRHFELPLRHGRGVEVRHRDARQAAADRLPAGLEARQRRRSAVAVNVASEVPAATVILEGAPASLVAIGERRYPWIPIRRVMRNPFESILKVPRIEAPILFLHSPEDGIIPIEDGRRLFEAARGPKTFVEVRGGHINPAEVDPDVYFGAVREFLVRDRLLPAPLPF